MSLSLRHERKVALDDLPFPFALTAQFCLRQGAHRKDEVT
jgi:hypothetical protein